MSERRKSEMLLRVEIAESFRHRPTLGGTIMNAIVVYESMYGNTRAVAEAIADGLGGARVLAVGEETTCRPWT